MKHSEKIIESVLTWAYEGVTDAESANRLGLTVHAVRGIRRRRGVASGVDRAAVNKAKAKPRYDWDKADWAKSNAEIARDLGCHHTAVSLRRKQLFGPKPKKNKLSKLSDEELLEECKNRGLI